LEATNAVGEEGRIRQKFRIAQDGEGKENFLGRAIVARF
jgi:hypothetical protein